jgi:hypothetical protein
MSDFPPLCHRTFPEPRTRRCSRSTAASWPRPPTPAYRLLERLRFLLHRLVQSRRIFRDPGRRPQGANQVWQPHRRRDGMAPHEVFRRVTEQAHDLIRRAICTAQRRHPARAGCRGHRLPAPQPVERPEQREWIREHTSCNEVMPVLTPIGLDPSHPFPRVLNKSLNFAVELEGTDAFGRNSGGRHRPGAACPAARDPPAARILSGVDTVSSSSPRSSMPMSANCSAA